MTATAPPNVRFLPGGDLLASSADILVCPVNTQIRKDGTAVMGAGLAKAFADKWPGLDRALGDEIRKNGMKPSGLTLLSLDQSSARSSRFPRMVFCIATKDHWRDPSRIQWVWSGLDLAVSWLQYEQGPILRDGATSIAVPRLGAGLGGLRWSDVRPLILDAAARTPGVTWEVYGPEDREG